MHLRSANLASHFLLNSIGQSFTRAAADERHGRGDLYRAPDRARDGRHRHRGVGAAAVRIVRVRIACRRAYFLSISGALTVTLAGAGARGLIAAIAPWSCVGSCARAYGSRPQSPQVCSRIWRCSPLTWCWCAFAPQISLAKLAPATVVAMFAASLPVSWAGWGLDRKSVV